jgi:ribosome-associated protein
MIRVAPNIAIAEHAIRESFVRASGPGGENVNKVATAVQLRLDVMASGLPDEVRRRLVTLAGKRMNQEGELLITAQRFRTQERNRQAAIDTLIRLVQRALDPPTPRIETRPTAASRRRRWQTKEHRARLKQSRTAPREEDA